MRRTFSDWLSGGAPWIWLNAGAVAASLIMVGGLLALIAVRGLGHGHQLGADLDLGQDRAILSTSPELFLSLRGRDVTTRPIKTTRPRGADEADDDQTLSGLYISRGDRAAGEDLYLLRREDQALGKDVLLAGARAALALDVAVTNVTDASARDFRDFPLPGRSWKVGLTWQRRPE